MNRSIAIVGAMGLSLVLSGTRGHAETIQQHTENQDERIEHGEESGRLTPHEANRLDNEEQTIQDERSRDLADGHLSRGERREIRHDQRAASRDIYRKKHNAHHD